MDIIVICSRKETIEKKMKRTWMVVTTTLMDFCSAGACSYRALWLLLMVMMMRWDLYESCVTFRILLVLSGRQEEEHEERLLWLMDVSTLIDRVAN